MHKPEWYFKGEKINEKETKSLKKFLKEHKNCEKGFTSIAQSNGIGTNLYILCWECKKWEELMMKEKCNVLLNVTRIRISSYL